MFWKSHTGEIISSILKDNEQNLGQWNFAVVLSVVNKKAMNEWKIIKSPLPLSLQSPLQQSHVVYCSATALPATRWLHGWLEVFTLFLFFPVWGKVCRNSSVWQQLSRCCVSHPCFTQTLHHRRATSKSPNPSKVSMFLSLLLPLKNHRTA